ncbi:hypothetical protein Q1695_016397 [Nippostrongylus brasiliensis]|nr:hypothetical protein Q1695_016397 [Nippostrongylus brasiliensis]
MRKTVVAGALLCFIVTNTLGKDAEKTKESDKPTCQRSHSKTFEVASHPEVADDAKKVLNITLGDEDKVSNFMVKNSTNYTLIVKIDRTIRKEIFLKIDADQITVKPQYKRISKKEFNKFMECQETDLEPPVIEKHEEL